MGKLSEPVEHWRDWRIPKGKYMSIRLFDSDGLSMPAADKYVFGPAADLEFWAQRGLLRLTDVKSMREIASRPMPDTMEEAVDWLRMVAAIHSA